MLRPLRPTSIESIKRLAKALKDDLDITHSEALERAAKQAGFQTYTHARRQLEGQPQALPAGLFPEKPTWPPGMSIHQFQDLCREAWIGTLRRLNPTDASRVIWESQADVLRVLRRVHAHTCTHGHVPTGGGFDFLAARPSAEKGCIEFEIDSSVAYIVRPKRLILEHLSPAPAESFLFLELDDLAPSAVHQPPEPGETRFLRERLSRQEKIVELSPGNYVTVSGRDKDGNHIAVPDEARTVFRGFNGKVLIVSKGSAWNNSGVYLGEHETLGPQKIRAILERTIQNNAA